ncbi:M48 family metallopeptidase [Sulfurimonas marina]|uniref:M48 family metallopeptidase n=1 Tax=Sulfurimonas marina TaxID=2590551 RepID=A0A7M1AX89_9BACT|nr:M48 family metallopeptidase [Sulfurimonas marina]QOP42069.1 M48 family metallopeptidase [Sulfurimonas marina]
MQLKGYWYAKDSAAQHGAILQTDVKNYTLIVDEKVHCSGLLEELKLDDRLGNITRRISLKDDSVFTCDQHDLIDTLFTKHKKANRFLHSLESKLHSVFISIVVLIVSIYLFVDKGIPYFSEKIAYALPLKTNELLSKHTMDALDKYLFKPSKLSLAQQKDIRKRFRDKLLPNLPEKEHFNYHLNFRLLQDRNLSLPNAMALPSGEIILTDKFVELCSSDEELDSIIYHEVGHIVHRDSLKMLIEGTFISVSVMVALGDLNGFADMGVGLGSMLVNLQYSREHESDADRFAFDLMLKNHMDPIAFATIMKRMNCYLTSRMKDTKEDQLSQYISTHPQTKERIEIAKRYSDCYKEGLTECK